MDCLIDYIGVLADGQPVPVSGLYINQLPGITLKGINSIVTSEKNSWQTLWADIQSRSSRRFQNAVQKEFAIRYKLHALKFSNTLEKSSSAVPIDETGSDPVAKWKGFIVKVTDLAYNDFYYRADVNPNAISAFQTIFISSLNLKCLHTGDTTSIKVFDMNTGEALFSKSGINLTVGDNVIQVNKEFFSNWIFVAFDSTSVRSSNFPIVQHGNLPSQCYTCDYCGVVVSGAISNAHDDPNLLTTGNDTFGLSGSYSILCSYNSVVCRNKNLFADAWMNLLGAELMIERIYSERLNAYTTIGKKEAEELRNYFELQFESALKDTINGIQLDDNDCCFSCETGGVEQIRSFI